MDQIQIESLENNISKKVFSVYNGINLITILSFFPFFAFVPGITAEVQPYCYLVSFLLIGILYRKLPMRYIIFTVIVLVYFFYYLIDNLLFIDIRAIPHIVIFLGPPIFFWCVFKFFHLISFSKVHTIFYIWVGVGLLQELFPSIFSLVGLKSILESLIPRFSSESLKEFGNRGVTSLSNEPSYAAVIFFATFVVIIYRFIRGEISTIRLSIDSLLYFIAIIFNASLTSFILVFVLIVALIVQTRRYFLSISLLLCISLIIFFLDTEFRVIGIIKALPDMYDAVGGDVFAIFASSLGSIREFSAYVGVKSAFYHFWGNGYYSSLLHFVDVAKEMRVDLSQVRFFDDFYGGRYINMKPAGYGALVLFELGVIPFIIVISIPIQLLWNAYKNAGDYKRFGLCIAIFALLLANFNSLSSLPSYWFTIVVALNIIQYRTQPANE